MAFIDRKRYLFAITCVKVHATLGYDVVQNNILQCYNAIHMEKHPTEPQPDIGLPEQPKEGVNFTGDAARERADLARSQGFSIDELDVILHKEHDIIQETVKSRPSSESA